MDSEPVVEQPLSEADESFHPPTSDDWWWSETHMFNFDEPNGLSCHIYPYFRRNVGIAQLQVWIWDSSASEPWLVPYGRSYWHLPYPEMDLRELRLEGLELDCVEPFKTIDVRYADGDRIDLSLRFQALRSPHLSLKTKAGGHWDQPYRVEGSVRLDGALTEVDTFGMRDKSWGSRTDRTRDVGGAYSWGSWSGDETFLAISRGLANVTTAQEHESLHDQTGRRQQSGRVPGYLVRNGEKSLLRTIERRVVRRRRGAAEELELDLEDELGRSLLLTGRCVRRLANQSFPGVFSWLSTTQWRTSEGEEFLGQDQEFWSPDHLGAPLLRLDT